MKKCPKCGEEVKTKDKFCSACGEELKTKKSTKKETKINTDEIFNKIGDNIEKILDTEDTSEDYKKKDIEDNKALAVLSYIGPLALIPYLKGKDSKYSYYHAVQGMNLLIVWLAYTILSALLYQIKVTKSCDFIWGKISNCNSVTPFIIRFPLEIVGFILFAISIVGIIYAIQGKAKKLPLVSKINIFK